VSNNIARIAASILSVNFTGDSGRRSLACGVIRFRDISSREIGQGILTGYLVVMQAVVAPKRLLQNG
jgi:hypothetical protein